MALTWMKVAWALFYRTDLLLEAISSKQGNFSVGQDFGYWVSF